MANAEKKDYATQKEQIKTFLTTYSPEEFKPADPNAMDEDGEQLQTIITFPYADQINAIKERRQRALYLDLGDMELANPDLFESISENTVRYSQLVADVVDDLVQESIRLENREPPVVDALDAFIFQRREMARQAVREKNATVRANNEDQSADFTSEQEYIRNTYPKQLMRRFEVYFKTSESTTKPFSVRQVKAKHIGKFVHIKGVIIRSTEVKPMASVITYTCDTCGNETYQPVNGHSFTPATACPHQDCVQSRAGGRLHMQVRGSKFIKFQELRIQELSDQVEVGSIPRSLTVYAAGENTRQCSPGDLVQVSGVFLPQARAGFRAMIAGLLSEVFLDAHHISPLNKTEGEDLDHELSKEQLAQVHSPDFYMTMARSIAPEIYGHDDIKKALLLQLISGVDKNASGMKIRGNINICLMGDPGVAKSQLLARTERLAPRCQYTTGRGSSGVGLTAAVMKDPLTGEMTLEGGALVLADQGICCIDEFDKMMEADRTAIHEVMEQQTISIAKAGIMTTLNARVAILAAANPAFGRYNPKRSVEANIQLPAALLSRFDILWLIQDKPDAEKDLRLARHIAYVHTHEKHPESLTNQDEHGLDVETTNVSFDPKLVRKYIGFCKTFEPTISEELTGQIVDAYVAMRREARNSNDTLFTSPRTVLAIIRLSTALARLRMDTKVIHADVNEAIRLMCVCKSSLRPDIQRSKKEQPIDQIFGLLKMWFAQIDNEQPKELKVEDTTRQILAKGFKENILWECIERYENLGVLFVNNNKTKIILSC